MSRLPLHRTSILLTLVFSPLAVISMLLVLLPINSVYAAPTLRLKLEMAPGTPSPIPSGQPFRVRLTYECSSSIGTDECVNMQVTSTLPGAFEGLQVIGNNDVTLTSYNSATKTATWNFRSPLPLGTTGQIEFEALYTPGTTLDGATGMITAQITGNGSSPGSGGITPPPADASPQPSVSKVLVAGGASNDLSIYSINVCAGNTGALDLTTTTVIDTLPPGAIYQGSTPLGTYNAGARTVTWGPLTVAAPGCEVFEVVVNYPSGTNPVGASKTNNVTVTTTPFGGTQQTLNTSLSHVLEAPRPAMRLRKTANGAEGAADTIIGGVVTTQLTIDNIGDVPNPLLEGNVTIDNVQIVDPIPAEQDVFEINTGAAITVDYQRNGINTWISGVPLGPSVAVASFPSWSAGDYVSNLRFGFNPLTLVDRSRAVTILSTIVNPPHGGGPSYTVTAASPRMVPNTATASAAFGGSPLTDQSSTATIEVAVPKARPDMRKTIISGSPALPEGTVTYQLRMRNGAFAPLAEPVIADLLPSQVTFDLASVTIAKNIAGCAAAPTFTQVDDYNGSGRTLLLWSWAGTGCSVPADDDARIEFDVTVNKGTRAGQYANRLALVNTSTIPSLVRASLCAGGSIPESSIFTTDAGLGIDTSRLCFSDPSDLTVRAIASIGSAKFVKGQLDTNFSRDPIVGATVQGGLITYQLELENTGNIDLTNLEIVDILPYFDGTNQNRGVRDQDLLGTTWTVQLAGPVSVSPSVPGLVIRYSSELNPCRPTLTVATDPTCTPMVDGVIPGPGVWSTQLPSDPTAVRSLKFDFGSHTLVPIDVLRFTFPAFAPVDAPISTPGSDGIAGNSDDTSVAWNTFAYESTRADDGSTLVAQPPRVGIEVRTPPAGLASYGNYAWHDVNQNGQQDEPAFRGINGVTVNLYQPGPDGLAGTADDILVGTQITRNDTSNDPGYYLFNGLQPGDYFAVFERPDGYTVTTQNSGADVSDSDIDPVALRTAITTLTAGENDITWDAGFHAGTVSLGNRLWYDTNNDSLDNDGAGNAPGSSTGIAGVAVQLFLDLDGNGLLTGDEQNWIAQATTNANGFYLFDTQTRETNGTVLGSPVPLFPAQYLVGIPSSQLASGGPLKGYYSSGTTMTSAGAITEAVSPDPDTGPDGLVGGTDDDRDYDDNGDLIRLIAGNPVPNPFAFYNGGVISKPIFVDSNEPTGEPHSGPADATPDASSNYTLDFGFYSASLGNLVWNDDGSGGGTRADGLRNGGELGIAGVQARLYSSNGSEILVGPDGLLGTADDAAGGMLTDASGAYAFGQLPEGSYQVRISRPTGYISTRDTADTGAPDTNTDNQDNGVGSDQIAATISSNTFTLDAGNELTVNTATGATSDPSIDFGVVRYYSLGNRVWDDRNNNGTPDAGENGIPNVTLRLLQSDGATPAVRIDGTNAPNVTTDASGFYRFDLLPAGDYIVEVLSGELTAGGDLFGYRSSTNGAPASGPYEPAPDPDNDIDQDDNGSLDAGGGVRSAILTLGDGSGTVEPTAEPGVGPASTAEAPDNQSNRTVDFGFWPTFSLGNLVWDDADNNGVVNGAEAGLDGVPVRLYRDSNNDGTPDGAAIASANTANGGHYLFTDLIADTYIVEIVPPAGYRSSSGNFSAYEPGPDADTDVIDNNDNGTISGAAIRSAPITLAGGEPTGEPATPGSSDGARDNNANYTLDFGIFQPLSLGNLVWEDLDNNGLINGGEVGIDGVSVRLYRDSNNDGTPDDVDGTPGLTAADAILTQTTNSGGHYLFTDLGADTYIVEVVNPAGMVSSTGQTLPAPYEPGPDVDTNTGDGDDNGTRGAGVARSAPITLAGGEPTGEPITPGHSDSTPDNRANYSADFGFYTALSLGNRVWIDSDNNGALNGGEVGLNGVSVRLYRDSNNDGAPDDLNGDTLVNTSDAIATNATAAGGHYLFTGLNAGGYIVEIVPPAGYHSSTGAASIFEPAPDPDTLATDSDDNGSAGSGVIRSATVTLSVGGEPISEIDISGSDPTANANSNLTVDFGLYSRVSLGNLIFIDPNNNGVFDGGDTSLAGATVALFESDGTTPAVDGDGVSVASQITAANGLYTFTNLNPGGYVVRVTPPAGYLSSNDIGSSALPDNDTNNDDNGVGSNVAGPVSSGVVTLTSGGEPISDGDADRDSNLSVDFGFYRPVSLGNQIWYDTDNNRRIDAGELGIDNVRVELFYDANSNGTIEDNSGSGGVNETLPVAVTTTSGGGAYLFTERTNAAGSPLAPQRPLNPGVYVVGIPASQFAPAGALRGLFSSGTSAGANGARSEIAPDDPDAGAMPLIDGDDNGASQGAGFYTGGVLAQPVTLALDGEPTGESPDIDPNPLGRPDASDNQTIDFGFYAMSLGNLIWMDDGSGGGTVNDGIRNGGEIGLAGVTVRLIAQDGSTVLDSVITGADGRYLFSGLAEGIYLVEVDRSSAPILGLASSRDPANANTPDAQDSDDNGVTLAITTVRSRPITLDAGAAPISEADQAQSVTPGMGNPARSDNPATADSSSNLHIDFGFVPADWGDLPDGSAGLPIYNTDRSGSEGPYHAITAGLGIGASIDAETNGQPGATASGDDASGPPDDEDGVTLPSFYTGLPADVTVAVQNSTGRDATLYGFIDFNRDGDFADTGEQVTIAAPNGTSGNLTLTFTVPANASFSSPLGARFRLSSDGGLGPDGPASDGEVEDYLITVTPTYSLGNRVWRDLDNDGTINAADGATPGTDGVTVRLLDSAGNTVNDATGASVPDQVTSGGGYYRFDNLLAGDYIVEVVSSNFSGAGQLTGLFSSTGAGQEADPDSDGDSNDNGLDTAVAGATRSAVITLGEGSGAAEPGADNDPASNPEAGEALNNRSNRTLDFGFISPLRLGDLVFLDRENDGVFNGTDSPLAGATVELRDSGGNPVTDITGATVANQTTDATGIYSFTNLRPGDYVVRVTPPAGYRSSDDLADTPNPNSDTDGDDNGVGSSTTGQVSSGTISLISGTEPINDGDTDSNSNLSIDFGFYRPVSLGDLAFEDADNNGLFNGGDSPLAGALVELFFGDGTTPATNITGAAVPSQTTAADGRYLFGNLKPGDYVVRVTPPAGYRSSDDLADTPNPNSDTNGDDNGVGSSTTGQVASGAISLTSGAEPINDDGDAIPDSDSNLSVDFGFYRPLALGNLVFNDIANNGIVDGADTPIVGAELRLFYADSLTPARDADGALVPTQLTDLNGNYLFTNLRPGQYVVSADASAVDARYISSSDLANTPNPDSDADADDNGIGSGGSATSGMISLRSNAEPINDGDADANTNLSLDFGFFIPASIGDFVWLDLSRDGVQDGGAEVGVPGVIVTLSQPGPDGVPGSADDILIGKTTTDSNGGYSFTGLGAGDYSLNFAEPLGYRRSPAGGTADGALDSDADQTTGQTIITTLIPGEDDPTWDAGLFYTAGLGNRVWLDRNANGVQDSGELGIPNISVELFRSDSSSYGTTITDADGFYFFPNLPPGSYYVAFTPPSGYEITQRNQGGNPDGDSDADQATGQTIITTIDMDERDPTWDAGLFQRVSLGNLVWDDINNNGLVDGSETGIANVSVRLYADANSDGQADSGPIATKTTDVNGNYQFSNLIPASYIVEVLLPKGYVSSTGRNGWASGIYEAAPDPNTNIDNDDNGTHSGGQAVRGGTVTIWSQAEPNTASDGDDTNGNLSVDFGLFRPAALGNIVWYDGDGDGLRDPKEPGTPGVTVTLYNGDGTPVPGPSGQPIRAVTDTNGAYSFGNLVPGDYLVGFSNIPSGYTFTTPNSSDDASDSDADPLSGLTARVSLSAGEWDLTLFAGLINPTAISLVRFSAEASDAGVAIRWETASEWDTWGFRIYRSASGDRADAVLVNAELILGKGGPGRGGIYLMLDRDAEAGRTYSYWLREVDLDGGGSEYGPVRTEARLSVDQTKVFLPLIMR